MLGEQVLELTGKRIGRRVLSTDGGFKVEVSFEDSGKLLGQQVNNMGTYWSGPRPDGSLSELKRRFSQPSLFAICTASSGMSNVSPCQ